MFLTEKKFCLYPKDYDLSKRWFVYYYETNELLPTKKRIKLYDKINNFETVEERLLCANTLIEKLSTNGLQQKKVKVCPLLSTLNERKHILRKKSYEINISNIKVFLTFLGTKNALLVNTEDVKEFITYLANKPLHINTINSYIIRLRCLYTILLEKELIAKNPFATIKVAKAASESKMYYTPNQQKKLKDYFIANDPQMWLGIQLLFYCFIRPNEMRQLQVRDIDLDNYRIRIRGSISKNKKTEIVVIPLHFRESLLFLRNESPDNYLFGSNGKTSTTMLSTNNLNTRHRKGLKKLEIIGNYSFYSWKHSGVVGCVKAGIHMKELQMQLRHHSLDMVNEYLKDLGLVDCEGISNNFPSI